MVYGFVKQSGGEIHIDSAPGQGTCMAIYLPRAFHAEASAVAPAPARVQGGDETILVVEDDTAVRASTVDMLTSLGYCALKAENAQQALAILQSGIDVDLLFSDIFLPGPFGGAELGARAKAISPGIALLFTSGQSLPPSGQGALPDGTVLLGKPYGREQLAASVRRQLGQRGAPVPDGIAAAAASLQTLALEPLRILVVDDSADAQELVCEMLMALGHTAHGVASGEAALALLAGERFDVLFCDAHLPGMAARDLAAQATRIAPRIRLLLASGEGEILAGGKEFAAMLIPKPYDLLQLQAALDDAALAPSRIA
jgi:CheY-like chemotaxis protein